MQHQSLQGATGELNPPHQATAGTCGPTVFVMVDNEKKETTLAKKTATGLSIVQIISGIASFIAQITIIIFITTESREHWSDYVTGIGEGIYCGVFFILAGGLGLLASRKPSICNISAFMTLSILASIFSGIQIILASIKLGIIDSYYRRSYILHWEPKMAMLSIMILAGVVEMIVAIVCAAICCRACCCSGNGASSGRVVYLAQGENGSGAAPVQVSGGVPVQMAYLPQATPVSGVMDQTLNDLPSYGDAVKGGQEETKEKSANGGYMRF